MLDKIRRATRKSLSSCLRAPGHNLACKKAVEASSRMATSRVKTFGKVTIREMDAGMNIYCHLGDVKDRRGCFLGVQSFISNLSEEGLSGKRRR